MDTIKCVICCEELDKYPTYSQEKCKHTFHTHCLVTWYRIGNNFCPCCNNNKYQFGSRLLYFQREICDRRVLNLKNEKNLNKKTKQILDDLEKIKIQLKENKKNRISKKYIKENNLSYKETLDYRKNNLNECYKLYMKQTNKYKQIMKETTKPIIDVSIVDLT